MTEFLQSEIGKWAVMNLSIGCALMWVFWMGYRERREDRFSRAEGAKACHDEQRLASKAISAAAEAIGGIKAATEAQNAQIAAQSAQIQAMQVLIAQCMRNTSHPQLPPEPDATD